MIDEHNANYELNIISIFLTNKALPRKLLPQWAYGYANCVRQYHLIFFSKLLTLGFICWNWKGTAFDV